MNSCKYPYERLSMKDLEALSNGFQKDLREKLDMVIPALSKHREHDRIIKMAALLVSFKNSSKETNIAIRSAVIPMIKNGLYLEDLATIKATSNVISNLEEGKVFWTQELQKALATDSDLEKIRTWLDYQENLNEIAEVFGIRSTIEGLLEKAIKNDKEMGNFEFWLNKDRQKNLVAVYKTFDQKENMENMLRRTIKNEIELNNIGFWQKHYAAFTELVKSFDSIKTEIRNRAESMLNKDGDSQTIMYWAGNLFLVSFLATDLGLEEEIKNIINNLVTKHTKEINIILKYTGKDEKEINEAVRKLIIKSNGYSFMKDCLTMANDRKIDIDIDIYRQMADNLLILANKLKHREARKSIVEIACSVYKGLKEGYNYSSRESIFEVNDKRGLMFERRVLKEAAKVIPGFKYKKQEWNDF